MSAKPNFIELGDGSRIPIVYEDRSVIAIDKPPGWMLVPFSWQKTSRNLQAAITSSVAARDFWAQSRNLKYLQHAHRLDAETTGVLLFAKSRGALDAYGDLFEARKVEKVYLAVVQGIPKQRNWICRLALAPMPGTIGKIRVDSRNGKKAETHFRVIQTHTENSRDPITLVEARPITGRTHQIRVHLAESGSPVIGDSLYARSERIRTDRHGRKSTLALRSVFLGYVDPFSRKRVRIGVPWKEFVQAQGFQDLGDWTPDRGQQCQSSWHE